MEVTPGSAHVAAAALGSRDWPATVRVWGAYLAALGIAWLARDPVVSKYALGVVALCASPGLARALLAPKVARLLSAAAGE